MRLKAGNCSLILDGNLLVGFAYAFELVNRDISQSYGFLSGAPNLLRKAQTATSVKVDLGGGEIADIRVLQVSERGIALIALKAELLDL